MGLSVRQLVDSLAAYGVLSSAEVAAIRESTAVGPQDVDSESLLRDLLRQHKLTKFQATNLYQGRGRGLVFGEYVILDKIGAGGMGQVYKAQHKRMKRVVALKVLPPQAVKSQKSIERFHQEVEVAAKLTHTNIVTAYDAGEAHGMHYLVMEYVDGKDLSSHIAKNGPLSLEQTLNVVLQAARGLAYAHDLNIIHRDIKPSNLLVDRKGVVKILDMGLARVSTIDGGEQGKELTADGEVMGTMDYMAPEQAVDTRSADHRADIYALGCTLYKLYTGQAPYGGETAVQKILAHRDKPIPSLRTLRSEAPDMVDRLFQKMLAKDPAARTQSMASIVSSLERMLSGVDDDRSSVMLGAEPVDADAGFLGGSALGLGSGVGVGMPMGSSLGGSSSSGGLPGASGVNIAPAQTQPAVATQTAHPHLPSVSGSAPTVAGKSSLRDTDAIVRSIMQAKPASAKEVSAPTNKKPNRLPLYAGCAAAAVVVLGIVTYVLTRQAEPTPESAAVPVAKPPAPAVPLPSPSAATAAIPASAVAAATAEPVVKQPEFPPKSSSAASFFGESPSKPMGSDPPSPPPKGDASPPTDDTRPVVQPDVTPTPPTGEVDLLARIDPATDGRHSVWKREGAALVCESQHGSAPRLLVPYAPLGEYDLVCSAVEPLDNRLFGVGLVLDGQQVTCMFNDDKCGLDCFEGRRWNQVSNPTYFHDPNLLFRQNEPVTVICLVRRGRTYVTLNGRRLFDFTGDPLSLTPTPDLSIPGGRLYLYGEAGTRFTSLTIGPPVREVPVATTSVNLAAAFEAGHVVEGIGTADRGGIVLNSEPNKFARLAFSSPLPPEYAVTAVIERGNTFGLGLPMIGGSRVAAVVDFRHERFAGLHSVQGGGVDINSTSRRYGMLLTPGEQHVVRVSVVADGQGRRVRMTVDGREVLDHAGSGFFESPEHAVSDRRAIVPIVWNTGCRIARLDLAPADGRRIPAPDTEARARAAASLSTFTQQADAKGASLEDKLSAVDNLRRKAATDLADPALRYVALDEALRIAVAAGDLSGAYEAAEDLATVFDVDPRSVQTRVLDVFKTPRSTQADAKKQFADETFKYVLRAAHAEQWDYALELASALDKLAGSNADLKRELKARTAEFAFAKTLSEGAVGPRAELEAGKPLEAAARTALGKYLCFGLGDWPGGLRSLSQGDDAGLKAAADLELAGPTTGDAKFAAAEKWWELSEKEKSPPLKWAEAERAGLWYRRAAAHLTDKIRLTTLGRRMTSLAQLRKASGGVGGPRRPLDAVKLGDRWYKVVPTIVSWDTAVQTCEQWGGTLVMLDSPAENDAVARLLLQSQGNQGMERATAWIGVSDLEQEGQFRRLDGAMVPGTSPPGGGPPPGSPGASTFAKWGGGQPNNQNGDEDCVALQVSLQNGQVAGDWADYGKMSGFIFICEWDH